MSGNQSRAAGNIQIFIIIDNVILGSTEIVDFVYKNGVNNIPEGYFKIVDRNAAYLYNTNTAIYGRLYFSDTGDNKDRKAAYLDFFITNIDEDESSDANITYKVDWVAGSQDARKKTTRAFTGTSVEAISDICKNYNYEITDSLTENDIKPTDTMTWRYIQDDMWEQLNVAVEKSWLPNDYMYWVYDDVNNIIKLSSFNYEKSLEDNQLFMFSTNAQTNTDESITVLTNPDYTIWYYDQHKKQNILGQNTPVLYPNVSFSGVVDTDNKQSGYKTLCFHDMLKSMGDTKQDKILANTGITDMETSYGELKVKRHSPNNAHKFYAGADVLRDRELATYGKVMYVTIYNRIGPSLGTKASIIVYGSDYKVTGFNINRTYTDTYILAEKYVRYTSTIVTATGVKSSGEAVMTTTLKYISDNIGDQNFDNVENIIKQLNKDSGKK